MFSRLKGYIKRFTTPKKDESYATTPTTFGDIQVSYIDAVRILDTPTSNILLEISYPDDMHDASLCANNFIYMISMTGIRYTTIKINKTIYMYIAGSMIDYDLLLYTYMNSIDYADNKILKKVISVLSKIDIMKDSNSLPDLADKNVFPYEALKIKLQKTDPIYVQQIDTYYISPNIISNDIDIMDKIKSLIIVAIYVDEKYILVDYVFDFIYCYKTKRYRGDIEECVARYKESYGSNFTISGYKNIFDINLSITDQENSSYPDIDEILD